jgi:anti-anti-sigma regulatory factor
MNDILGEATGIAEGDPLQGIIDSLFFPFYIVDAETYRIETINEAARKGREVGGMTCHQLTHQNPVPCDSGEHGCPLQEVKRTGQPATMIHTHFTEEGEPRLFEVRGVPIQDENGAVVKMIEYSIDITEQKRAEEESARALEALADANEAKEEQIQQLSTPVIEVWDGILVTPVIGVVDGERGTQIMRTLLDACSEIRARGVIIDIPGIEVIDENTALHLIRMSKAIQLLGARPVISGVSPEVAKIMIHTDVASERIKTVRSLKEGLHYFLPADQERTS